MIYCTAVEPYKYVEQTPSGEAGLYTTYGHSPELFNLLSRTATVMFMYEPGFEGYPSKGKCVAVAGDHFLVNSLSQEVNGRGMIDILSSTCPITMLDMFIKHRPVHIKAVKLYGNWENFILAMRLRVLQFRKYYRGAVVNEGKVVTARFRSDLSMDEDATLTRSVKTLKDQFIKQTMD
jgi:hypothetical protein